MDYHHLLDFATDLGYRLAMCGAETFRVEDTINRILSAYGIESETFAITNCLTVSILTDEGIPITRMRRIGHHGNDLDSVEKYNNLSRRICQEKPSPEIAIQWLNETDKSRIEYTLPLKLLGCALGAAGFAVFFGGTFVDALCSGLCGILVGLVNELMNKWKVNLFFSTIAAAFFMAIPAYAMGSLNIAHNADTVIIGALMILVPGLLFTNAMRDIIFGDTNSGINRIVQVLLIAAAIALGTGAAWNISNSLWGIPLPPAPQVYSEWILTFASFVGCVGFFILFNIHGFGGFLCALGGVLSYVVYALVLRFTSDYVSAFFYGSIVAALYAEVMARIRKYPAISYLVVSIFPLIPGAGIYYTTNFLVKGDMTAFTQKGMETIATAGAIAVGVLIVSTAMRVIAIRKPVK